LPPKTHSVLLSGGGGSAKEPLVVRNAVLPANRKPEEGLAASSFLIGTSDEFRMLLSTTKRPLFEAAYAPRKDAKSFLDVVTVWRASLNRNTFPSERAARITRPSGVAVKEVLPPEF